MNIPMVGKVDAVLFDFEGTLVDFQWKLADAVAETLEMLQAMGFPRDGILSRKFSTLMPEAMQMAGAIGLQPEYVREQIGIVYDKFDQDALTRWKLRPDILILLELLKKNGVRRALVSNVGEKALTEALSKLRLEEFFEVCVNRNSVTYPKPNSEGINLALDKLGVQRGKSVFVGDSLDDINAARNAGLRVIIIADGENLREEILAARPERIIHGYEELLNDLT
jgi:phosphoglycolate phosphatase